MDVAPEGRDLLPVACTLGPLDGAQRLAEWRRVTAKSGIGSERLPGQLILRFRHTSDVAAELQRLVDAERDCCAFLGWSLTKLANECHVTIAGNDDELNALALLAV